MELSHEDILRLNVLLANDIEAIRIDENHLIVYGLSGDKESQARLNPNCRNDQYLKKVRAFISGYVLGSPEGYPIFLRRWTRMGHARDSHLAELLKLGEPEALVAVTGASGLTDDLARKAWWVEASSDNARRMLQSKEILHGNMGPILVEHLVEHLPFETEAEAIIDIVTLILQSGLASEDQKKQIWSKGKIKNPYHIGFLTALPEDLLEPLPARHDFAAQENKLRTLATDNDIARLLLFLLDGPGQTFLDVAETILRKPANQDEVVALLQATSGHCVSARRTDPKEQDIEQVIKACSEATDNADGDIGAVKQAAPKLDRELQALLTIAGCGDAVVTPIFAKTDAAGTVMRKRLEPITKQILQQFAVLRGLV